MLDRDALRFYGSTHRTKSETINVGVSELSGIANGEFVTTCVASVGSSLGFLMGNGSDRLDRSSQ